MEKALMVIVTGASRGLGRALALSFANTPFTLHIRITASPLSGALLASLSMQIKEIRGKRKTIVECLGADLSDTESLASTSKLLFSTPRSHLDYTGVIFINNHGSLGELSYAGSHDPAKMAEAFSTNVTSCCYLSSEAVKYAQEFTQSCKFRIVHISSLCAVQPFQSWGVYCAGKAARDMYHRVIAAETSGEASIIKTLNYAPGPLDTDMQKQIREGVDVHKETQKYYRDMKDKGILVPPEISAEKCLQILRLDTYESGAHVDFYDNIDTV